MDPCADGLPYFAHPESRSSSPIPPGISAHPLFPSICMQRVRYLLHLKTSLTSPFSPLAMYFQTELFHRLLLPSFQVSVHSALTTFETKISPWTHPLQWLDANTEHLCSIFHAITHLTQEADIGEISFPETMIYQVRLVALRFSNLVVSRIVLQRLIVYIFAHNMFASSDKTYILYLLFFFVFFNVINSLLGKLTDTLKRWQEWDIVNLIRNQESIKKQLSTLFRAASHVSLHAPSV